MNRERGRREKRWVMEGKKGEAEDNDGGGIGEREGREDEWRKEKENDGGGCGVYIER